MTRDESFPYRSDMRPEIDPVSGHLIPRKLLVSPELVHRGTPLDVEPELAAGAAPAGTSTPARVPDWVQDPAKWQAMTRAERRAVERHHRRVSGGRGSS